ncbi:MAG: hypothetical protein AAF570_24320, partial [Bacteroidota bacterium]
MRIVNFTFLILFCAFGTLFSQDIHRQSAQPDLTQRSLYDVTPAVEIKRHMTREALPVATHASLPAPRPTGKTNLTVDDLGTASNIYSILRPSQNQIVVDNDEKNIMFIHRNDITFFAGDNGSLRYDYSLDGGVNWTTDIGPINPQLLRPARYPNISLCHWDSASCPPVPVYYAATLDPQPSWDGHVYGNECDMGNVSVTEYYDFQGQTTLIPGGLCQGLPGEMWAVDYPFNDPGIKDSIFVYHGDIDTCDASFSRHLTIQPNFRLSSTNTYVGIGPNISFSPDGQTGWIGIVGDIVGGTDSVLNPIFFKSTDAGQTWGPAMEVDLSTNQMVVDSLQSVYVQNDGMGGLIPVSSGRPTLGGDYDITVDKDGNVHMVTVIASAGIQDSLGNETRDEFSIYPGLEKFVADVYTTDGG